MITRSGRIEFTPQSGPHTVTMRIGFDRPVLAVEVALVGYEARYTSSDHHVRQLRVELHSAVGARVDDGWEANLIGTLYLHDDSGADFTGWIDYLLFVELGKRPLPEVHPPIHPPLEPLVEG